MEIFLMYILNLSNIKLEFVFLPHSRIIPSIIFRLPFCSFHPIVGTDGAIFVCTGAVRAWWLCVEEIAISADIEFSEDNAFLIARC